MVNEPVDLRYDTWFPTDWLSANLRQVVSVIFSEPSSNRRGGPQSAGHSGMAAAGTGDANERGQVAQTMDVEQVSDSEYSQDDTRGSRAFLYRCLLQFQRLMKVTTRMK